MDYRANAIDVFDFDVLHMQLNTPVFILILVLVVMFFLNKLLFKPILRTLDNREGLLKSLQAENASSREEISTLAQSYQEKLEAVRAQVGQLRTEETRATQDLVAKIMEKAREDAAADLKVALAQLGEEVERAKTGLEESARRLADEAASKVLAN